MIKKYVNEMLNKKYIKSSTFSYVAFIFIVKKLNKDF